MRNNNNLNTKGATNVKSKAESYDSDDWVNAETADVIRDESKWNAFQLVGDTNAEEANHVADLKNIKNEKEMQKVLDRGLALRMGRMVALVMKNQKINIS